jgi:aerobic-type carbon monoxide dehydrogenase small subunit (CoxS/CutS family)
VGQCGYCQPSQLIEAVASVKEQGPNINEADLNGIRDS